MNERDLEFIKLRYVDKKTYREIGKIKGISFSRAMQIIQHALDHLIPEVEKEKWRERKGMANLDGDLQKLLYLVGDCRGAIRNLIQLLHIEELADFRKYTLTKYKGIGPTTLCHLKLALMRLGVPYRPDDNMEDIEKCLMHLENQTAGLRLRFKILLRDGFTCQYCGRSPRKDPAVVLNVDPIKPRNNGGTFEEKNLITSCRECNIGKGTMEI
jgi:hypothetical protein